MDFNELNQFIQKPKSFVYGEIGIWRSASPWEDDNSNQRMKCTDNSAWHDGSCCCNCKHQIQLNCHPWNKEFGKGEINKSCGFVCAGFLAVGENIALFSDRKHGFCELHTSKIEIE
jgi:hypothetical protein